MKIIIAGVSGSGKSTIGKLVAQRLGCEYADADDFHPPENIAKMKAGAVALPVLGQACSVPSPAPETRSIRPSPSKSTKVGAV